MHAEKQKQLPPKRVDSENMYSFKPKINELVTREQFKKAQDRFNSKLNKKKAQHTQTRPRSPRFTKTSSKGLEREYLNEKDAPMVDKMKMALMKRVNEAGGTANSIRAGGSVAGFSGGGAGNDDKAGQNPSGTKSMTHLMTKRREELEEKRKADQQKAKEDQARFDKQNRVRTLHAL